MIKLPPRLMDIPTKKVFTEIFCPDGGVYVCQRNTHLKTLAVACNRQMNHILFFSIYKKLNAEEELYLHNNTIKPRHVE